MRNYFNYFTEIEEHFSRLRGRNLFVSPLDWCLIELWKQTGIPLHVVLRGIDRSFESASRKNKKAPRTLFYCHPAVTEAFEEHQAARIGAHEESEEAPESPLDPGNVVLFLENLLEQLAGRSGEGFGRAAERVKSLLEEKTGSSRGNDEELDRALSHVQSIVADALLAEKGREELKELRAAVRKDLKIYRKHLSEDVYAQLFENYLKKRVVEDEGLPSFSLFDVD